jgi:prophage tail gpP-like protein
MAAQRDPSDLSVGGFNDAASITIDGQRILLVESYEVKCSVMTQPAAFSLRLGHAGIARELLEIARPGKGFQFHIGEVLIQSGIIDGRAVPGGNSTVVEIKGRDYMRKLMNCHVEEDTAFTGVKTYYDLTRKVMNLVGLDQHELVAGNGANRRAVTQTEVKAVPAEEQVRVVETGLATSGGSKVEYKWLKAKVGQRWYDWLQEQYRLAGLFLWCAGDGKFVLSTPGFLAEPSYICLRQRGVPRNTVNVLRHSFRDDTTNRHAQYIVYGRFGRGKGGRNRIKGEYVDPEMVNYGFSDVITYHDDHVATTAQADYLARRYASEERRSGWELSYTFAGHRTPQLSSDAIAIWGPDTVALAADDELGIAGNHYIESVTFGMNPQKETTIELIRPDDLLYIAEANQEVQRQAKAALAQNKANPGRVVISTPPGTAGASGTWTPRGNEASGSW